MTDVELKDFYRMYDFRGALNKEEQGILLEVLEAFPRTNKFKRSA